MSDGRRQHNLTVLADGTVLATGGNSSGADLVDLDNGVYRAELWDPATGQWQNQASMQVTRQYHSTALLLPDGRVLSSGGGVCGQCNQVGYLAKNAEVFSPSYLFDDSGQPATRPVISSAPGDVAYNSPFAVSTPNAASISKVALVRLGAVTHSVNMEQRYVPLSFTSGGGTVTPTAPANANVAPPGPYMLFVIDGNGVPSVAKIVNVGGATPPAPPAVSSVSPAGGATGVARTTTVSATFDRAMNRASVESAFSLRRTSSGASVSGSFSWSGNTVTFTPSAPLNGATGHTATVGTGARDAAGVALASPRTWQFTTANQPLVSFVSPAENATEVLPNAVVVAVFDAAMDKPSAQAAFSLRRTSDGAPVGGTLQLVRQRVDLRSQLQPGGGDAIHGKRFDRRAGPRRESAAGREDVAVHHDRPSDHRVRPSPRQRIGRPPRFGDAGRVQQGDGQALGRGRLLAQADQRWSLGRRQLRLVRERADLHAELAPVAEHPVHRRGFGSRTRPGRQHAGQPDHVALHHGGIGVRAFGGAVRHQLRQRSLARAWRRGKIHELDVFEDSQEVARALGVQAESGLEEAAAAPIVS